MNRSVGLASLLWIGCTALAAAQEPVDYAREVKPLLARHCVSCHGVARPRGGLRLDAGRYAIEGGKSGPVIEPGSAADSSLIEAVLDDAGGNRMPLKRPPLSEAEVDTLRRWIDQGAKFPDDEVPTTLSETHWAFVAPQAPVIPLDVDTLWTLNPVDHFVRAGQAAAGLEPAPEADRATLIRRITLDLTGLPPTPDEVESFRLDTRPAAYERLVDRLLASPAYGERWARPWLDLARYADSNGYSIDAPRSIWKYRDWVIDALNQDMPFDAFLTDQLAGDLKPNATMADRIATGFHRNTQINEEGGIDPEQFRVESINDRVNTTSTVFLGLTVGCAQCHDHKYDPISQREYYSLFAFFNSVDEPEIDSAEPAEIEARHALQQQVDQRIAGLERANTQLASEVHAWEQGLDDRFKNAQPASIRSVFGVARDQRNPRQARQILELFLQNSPAYAEPWRQIDALRKQIPPVVKTLVVRERSTPRATFIHLGGDFTRKGDPVSPAVPAVLPRLTLENTDAIPNRLDLAHWLTRPDHPLTARVTVNRAWQAFFGAGLVETENDFGTQGAPPTHPELLDWLALSLIERDWSTKALHRQIVTSRTYRQSSNVPAEVRGRDPSNRWLARQSRLRLDGEFLRDSALSAAGLLTVKLGGPSVFPPLPDGVMGLGQVKRTWKADTGPDRYRRGLYTYFWRSSPHPALTVFDAPNGLQTCTRRPRSNTPLQALLMLNDEAYFEAAQALAHRIEHEAGPDDASRIDRLFQIGLGRSPSSSERAALLALLTDERSEQAAEASPTEPDPWLDVCRVLLNLDEFLTRE